MRWNHTAATQQTYGTMFFEAADPDTLERIKVFKYLVDGVEFWFVLDDEILPLVHMFASCQQIDKAGNVGDEVDVCRAGKGIKGIGSDGLPTTYVPVNAEALEKGDQILLYYSKQDPRVYSLEPHTKTNPWMAGGGVMLVLAVIMSLFLLVKMGKCLEL